MSIDDFAELTNIEKVIRALQKYGTLRPIEISQHTPSLTYHQVRNALAGLKKSGTVAHDHRAHTYTVAVNLRWTGVYEFDVTYGYQSGKGAAKYTAFHIKVVMWNVTASQFEDYFVAARKYYSESYDIARDHMLTDHHALWVNDFASSDLTELDEKREEAAPVYFGVTDFRPSVALWHDIDALEKWADVDKLQPIAIFEQEDAI